MRQFGAVADVFVLLANFAEKPQLVAASVFKSDENQKVEGLQRVTIQPAEKHQETVSALRQRLHSLAHYVVPKFVIPWNEFPILPSHKMDRKALKRMIEELDPISLSSYVLETAGETHAIVPTETPEEKTLESMWAKILDLDAGQIGPETNFLSLGGDSTADISLASVARQAGFVLAVPTNLKVPKLKGLAIKLVVVERPFSQAKPVFKVSQWVIDAALDVGLVCNNDVEYGKCFHPVQNEINDKILIRLLQFIRVHLDKWNSSSKEGTRSSSGCCTLSGGFRLPSIKIDGYGKQLS